MIARLIAVLVMLATAGAAVASSAVRDETGAPARSVGRSSHGASAVSTQPKPLGGVPLRGSTGLRLLVASAPPFVLDLDTGRIRQISGLKIKANVVLTVFAAGRDAIVWLDRNRARTAVPRAEVYVVRRGATKASRLATAWDVAPAADGAAVWLKRYDDARRCSLLEVSLDGNERQSPRPVPCSARLVDAGIGAVLIDGTSVLDPRTGETLLEATRVWAMVGEYAITTEGSQGPFTVSQLRSGERWLLPYPSKIAGQGGTDERAHRSPARAPPRPRRPRAAPLRPHHPRRRGGVGTPPHAPETAAIPLPMRDPGLNGYLLRAELGCYSAFLSGALKE